MNLRALMVSGVPHSVEALLRGPPEMDVTPG